MSTEKSVDDAIKKLATFGDQDVFDNFGNLVASQLKSISMEDAIKLQMDISNMVNKRLLMIHQSKSVSSSRLSRPSTYNYSTNSTNYSSDDTSLNTPLYEYTNEYDSEAISNNMVIYENLNPYDRKDVSDNAETGDVISIALRGILIN
ncbi:unnamed protein product [Psylliodes chrysocephalus]|uniref:Uncharacterized protein n=1 Tax=Psylliodes chrysocephalus TaxID=3402493 RepID=A0A9P0CP39_9CUCU|nr:unnamed protein product [Psylliodes chrysocephala]